MVLIVGLGNPGKKYENTRHNTGFLVIDMIASHFGITINQKKFNGLYTKFKTNQTEVILLKPQTYMNLSGDCVASFVHYFKVDIEDILIITDDLDLPIGKIRIRDTGSAGGQKGLSHIMNVLKTNKIARLRVGIGNNKLIDTADYVLGKVEPEKREIYDKSLKLAKECAIDFITEPITVLQNSYNHHELA